jgi:hypothetical protein
MLSVLSVSPWLIYFHHGGTELTEIFTNNDDNRKEDSRRI